ncbi:MAG: hypothetical protein M1830_007140 [Pleopsidium flavum]|nr:MAG: hypothetical protein M1830_007140 [Pleopsidium flavum]
MPFQVLRATPADAATMMIIQFKAMAHEPYHHAVFPGGNTPSARGAAEKRRMPDLLLPEDSENFVMKVVEGETIVGWGKWKVFPKERGREEWEQPSLKQIQDSMTWAERGTWRWEASSEFLGRVTAMRQRHVQARAHLLLNPCMTDPQHQRRGVGAALVQWGIDHADALGLPAYLEATAAGRPLYERCGFRVIDKVVVDCDRWPEMGERGHFTYVMMVREARTREGECEEKLPRTAA